MLRMRNLLVALCLFLLPVTAYGADDKALMLTVFGTSTEASITFDELLPLVEKQFPDRKVVVPYTSGVIRNKLNAKIEDPTQKILSPTEMLDKLKGEGFTDIAVVSTLLFPGVEHDKLKASVESFDKANKAITVTYTPPLLTDETQLALAAKSIEKNMLKDGINVVVAHGTHDGHAVEKIYENLASIVAKSNSNARVGSIEGVPSMDDVMAWVGKQKAKDVRFVVFMFVAGDHAENDIASDEDDSLFSAAKALGKNPSVAFVETSGGKRIASLGLDPEYRQLLLDYFAKQVGK